MTPRNKVKTRDRVADKNKLKSGGQENTSPARLSLGDEIRLQIKTHGPISLATYMSLCLTHPQKGYYKTADPLGASGDFITAPEISQMFGEMLGAWVLLQWHILGTPDHFDLVELGPGRGTLIADAIRVIAHDPKALGACNIVLLETNPVLIELQRQKLAPLTPRWITEIAEINKTGGDNRPLIILANEFFDALPIRQFQFQDTNWHEREIGLKDNKLVWGLSPTPLPASILPTGTTNPSEGEIREVSPLGQKTIASLAQILNSNSGAMLIVDYGYEQTRAGNSFQAVSSHKYADPLADPGQSDLTAHVDFAALIRAAENQGARAYLSGSQKSFLSEMGIKQRAEKLIQSNPERADSIKTDLERLIDPSQMGELFKTMTIYGVPDQAPFEICAPLSETSGISHGFFGRRGGCSGGEFSSLNTSLASDDQRNNVMRNRAIAMNSLKLEPKNLVTMSQVHSSRVVEIGPGHDPKNRPEADGMVTKQTGVALGVLAADCTPVLFADQRAKIIGVCHAGWRGALAGIVGNTVEAMVQMGAARENIIAAIGPTIWPQDYQVGPKFTEEFLKLYPDGGQYIVFPDKTASEHFDLPGFVLDQLRLAGIKNPVTVGASTYQHPELYFSHRFATHQNRKTGRQIAIIALNG
ncbi:SAM-dependent methyltransferase, MidA [hydrothermal vent metagenome]|uniref:SAM-dependent methyltransferase, MidA n=1 Tax=hydrothermal vent metagenome TaxID=652676 RepID=A0A3B0TJN9_9ZZZZ